MFGLESHYICLFRHHLGLCIKKSTKNALTLTTQKYPLGVSLSHTHIGLPYGFNLNFPTSISDTFIWESTLPHPHPRHSGSSMSRGPDTSTFWNIIYYVVTLVPNDYRTRTPCPGIKNFALNSPFYQIPQ